MEVPLPRKQFLLWAEELFRVRMFSSCALHTIKD
jgi:hypothetical protein